MAKTGYIGVGNVARKASGLYVGVNNVARKAVKAYVGDANGKAQLWWDQSGIMLDKIPEGSIVKIKENNIPVEFYVAKHDYESELNGAGRVLLLRKDCYDKRLWNTVKGNTFSSSAILSWLNGAYYNVLETAAKSLITPTKYYYSYGNQSTAMTTGESNIFILSVTELTQRTQIGVNTEGKYLGLATEAVLTHINGVQVDQWTRSPETNSDANTWVIHGASRVDSYRADYDKQGARPCFTLPSTAKFDKNYNLIG